ncbi:hypothetical protein ACIODS_12540 [Micromonospora chalcea]|uniref:hypothetical protein n=1 Tax=Micromonospora chalcea TaxID=1874 RepID=UPI003824E7C5
MTDLMLQPIPGPDSGRVLPGPSSDRWNDMATLVEIAGLPPEFLAGAVPSRDELVAMYGTVVPAELAAMGALDADVRAAERYAAETLSPGVAA